MHFTYSEHLTCSVHVAGQLKTLSANSYAHVPMHGRKGFAPYLMPMHGHQNCFVHPHAPILVPATATDILNVLHVFLQPSEV